MGDIDRTIPETLRDRPQLREANKLCPQLIQISAAVPDVRWPDAPDRVHHRGRAWGRARRAYTACARVMLCSWSGSVSAFGSRDEPPTWMVAIPAGTSQALFQIAKRAAGMVSVICVDSPTASVTFFQPTRRCGGSPAATGKEAYTCATSAPARAPVFFSEKLTVASPFDASATLGPE